MGAAEGEKERLSAEIVRTPVASSAPVLPTVNPTVEKSEPVSIANRVHPSVYVISWITLSSSVIIFNKWILATAGFHYPIVLTTWHLAFATLMTQIMARTTKLLDGRKTVKMTGRIYLRAIVPIGAAFSLSLICGNLTYLHLSVAFIQMLKVPFPPPVKDPSFALLTSSLYSGHHARRRSDSWRILRRRKSRLQKVPQRLLHRHRHRHCLYWRNQIRLHRLPLPARRHRLRSHSPSHGPTPVILCRIQNGSPRLPLLLRACLHMYEFLRRHILRVTVYQT